MQACPAPPTPHRHRRRRGLLPRPESPAMRGLTALLHRRHLHRHLLSPGLPRAHAPARELSLLCAGRAGRERRFSPLPALPPRAWRPTAAGVVGHAGRLHHPGAAGGAPARRSRSLGRWPRPRWPQLAQRLGVSDRHLRRIFESRLGHLAAAIPANPPPADGQAIADRHGHARHPGGTGQRLCQRAPLQRRICAALRTQPHAAAQRGHGARHGASGQCSPGLPPALRCGGAAGFFCTAPVRRGGVGAGRRCPDPAPHGTPVRGRPKHHRLAGSAV